MWHGTAATAASCTTTAGNQWSEPQSWPPEALAARQPQWAEGQRGCSHSNILTTMLLWCWFRGHLTICHQLWSSGLSRLPRPRTSCACQSRTRIGTGVAHFADHNFTTNFIIVLETFTKFPREMAMRVATGNDWQRVLRPKGDWQRVLRTSSGSSSISRSVSTSRSLSWTIFKPSISGGRGQRGLAHFRGRQIFRATGSPLMVVRVFRGF